MTIRPNMRENVALSKKELVHYVNMLLDKLRENEKEINELKVNVESQALEISSYLNQLGANDYSDICPDCCTPFDSCTCDNGEIEMGINII